ncbi:MAG: 50S ribosomal protein L24 [Phycisphaerae bacterium]
MAQRIKRGDTVQVVAGKDKGRTGTVLKVLSSKETDEVRLVVEGVNRQWRNVKPSRTSPQGGRIQKDGPIHVSNVMLLDPETNKVTRVRFEMRDGVKHRVAVKSGTSLGKV